MRHSLSKVNLVRLRSIIGLTQEDLSKVLGCSRMTIQAIESDKLRLSEKMAAKIALHTGVSMRWLLANNCKLAPMCERDPESPYTREIYQMTRAEVHDSRIHPLDVRAIQNLLAVLYHRVCDA